MESKYDRQLRLWGADGQRALAEAHVLILGATTTAAETLKNLILPGVACFTIVDDAITTAEALGNNFFVTMEDYTERRPIAQALVQHLKELNAYGCVGTAIVEPCERWVEVFTSQQTPLRGTLAVDEQRQQKGENELQLMPTLIVATPKLPAESLRRLATYLKKETNIPLVFTQTNGLTGLIHVQEKEQLIIYAEPKPETRVEDLRIFNPFPALQEWFLKHNPEDDTLFGDNLKLHSHIPWIAILYNALQRLRSDRGEPDFIPRTKMDYDALKKVISSFIRRPTPPQEGFMEALEKCCIVLNRPSHIPLTLQQILQDARTDAKSTVEGREMTLYRYGESLEGVTAVCWAVVRGIKRFMAENNGVPPFCGYVPDITTTTEWYSELRAIYTDKMEEDCTMVFEYALEELMESGVDGDETCVFELTKALIQNLWTLQLISFSPDLDEEVWVALQPERFTQYFENCSADEERFTVELYAALLAGRHFKELYGRAAGCARECEDERDTAWEEDARELLRIIEASRQDPSRSSGDSITSDLTLKACMEVARSGEGEPVFTACIIGAAAAQECIKLIQHRRVPIQQPLVFDGYRSCFWLAPSVCVK